MSLFERLISNDSKSNTVLTNVQILAILEKEFHMNISALHELEVEIYINIVKKFLKDWPQWDVFDRIINKLKKKSAHSEIKNILEQKYKHLKEYLRSMIEIATPLACDAIKQLKGSEEKSENAAVSDMVLEIYCTRRMLNNFIYNRPHPQENDSLFNLVDFKPYSLNPALPDYSFTSILHWSGVHFSIDLPSFQYTRFTSHKLSHVLINEANGPRNKYKELDTDVYMNIIKSSTNNIIISSILHHLDSLLEFYRKSPEFKMIQEIFRVVKRDLVINSSTVEIPGSYKLHSSKYPYIRKLFTDVGPGYPTQHNLCIEETITPIQDWHIGKFVNLMPPHKPYLKVWLKFECFECKQKFNGAEFMTSLREHFKLYHSDEPDWTCTNCNKSFSMVELTANGWKHKC